MSVHPIALKRVVFVNFAHVVLIGCTLMFTLIFFLFLALPASNFSFYVLISAFVVIFGMLGVVAVLLWVNAHLTKYQNNFRLANILLYVIFLSLEVIFGFYGLYLGIQSLTIWVVFPILAQLYVIIQLLTNHEIVTKFQMEIPRLQAK